MHRMTDGAASGSILRLLNFEQVTGTTIRESRLEPVNACRDRAYCRERLDRLEPVEKIARKCHPGVPA